jgi:signal recognition particle subunit SEC65
MEDLTVVKNDVKSSQETKKHKSKTKDDETESVGSLKDFIVDDDEEDLEDDGTVSDEASDDESSGSETSDDSAIEEDSEVEEPKPKKKRVAEDPELIKMLAEEAEAFTKGPLQGTVVGGRTLRSRAPEQMDKRKPRDNYYERFGRKAEQEAIEKFTKKDIIEWVRKLALEHKAEYETSTGQAWPVLTPKMSLDTIQSEYKKIKRVLELPDSDQEDDDVDQASDDEDLSEDDEMDDSESLND